MATFLTCDSYCLLSQGLCSPTSSRGTRSHYWPQPTPTISPSQRTTRVAVRSNQELRDLGLWKVGQQSPTWVEVTSRKHAGQPVGLSREYIEAQHFLCDTSAAYPDKFHYRNWGRTNHNQSRRIWFARSWAHFHSILGCGRN